MKTKLITILIAITILTPRLLYCDPAAIQAQIAALQADIAEKKREVHKDQGSVGSSNAYKRIIADEQAQVLALQTQLHAN